MSKDTSYLSIKDQAKAEVNKERNKEAVGELKNLYVKLGKAETIVANLKREIDDYADAVEQGNA